MAKGVFRVRRKASCVRREVYLRYSAFSPSEHTFFCFEGCSLRSELLYNTAL